MTDDLEMAFTPAEVAQLVDLLPNELAMKLGNLLTECSVAIADDDQFFSNDPRGYHFLLAQLNAITEGFLTI